jgi:hypothetical protein
MKMPNKLKINAPADKIWALLHDDFLELHTWMASIVRTEEITGGKKLSNAPATGRRAYIFVSGGKTWMNETITGYDVAGKSMQLDTTLGGMSRFSPIHSFTSDIRVKDLGNDTSEVTWDSTAKVQYMGWLLYLAIKKSLSAGMLRNLEEIQHLVETGKAHPRKVEKQAKYELDMNAKAA